MRILITGITGFVGGHLVEALAPAGHTLFGLSRSGKWPADLAHLTGSAELHRAELGDGDSLELVIRTTKADWVFHLAGFANTGASFREPQRCWEENLNGTRTLYDAIVRTEFRPRILFVSTGLAYGEPDESGGLCDERTTLKPASPYAASKAAADLLSYQYSRSPGLDVVRVRLFNQIGPRQSADYAVANFARQVAAAESGNGPPLIETGDLSAQRDITDVRDMVAAFPLLLAQGVKGEVYNAGHGDTHSMQSLLDRLVGMARVKVEVRQNLEPGRRADTTVTRANAAKLRRVTGWTPRISLEQTLSDILDDWRRRSVAR